MSFQRLIDTVKQSFEITDDEAFDRLSTVVDVAGKDYFTIEKLESFNIPDSDQWIKILIQSGCLSVFYSYSCTVFGQSELADDKEARCVYCNNVISTNLEHEVREAFILNDDFHQAYGEYSDAYYKAYLMEDYFPHLNELVSLKRHVVPFIGAGLGLPVGLPDWKGLFRKLSPYVSKDKRQRYEDFIKRGDLLNGIEYLKSNSATMKTDEYLKRFLCDLIIEKAEKYLRQPHDNQNYKNLIKFNPPFFLTTNYDYILPTLITRSTGKYVHQTTLDGIADFQEKLLRNSLSVIHIHGTTSDFRTMVVTESDYKSVYENRVHTDGLKYLMTNKVLLFIGFSFSDVFFQRVYKDMKNVVNGVHYAVVADPDSFDDQKYAEDNLKIIGLRIRRSHDEELTAEEYQTRYIRAIDLMFKYLDTH